MKTLNMNKSIVYIFFMVCFMLFSCEKENNYLDEEKEDNNKPEVIGISTELKSYEKAVSELNKIISGDEIANILCTELVVTTDGGFVTVNDIYYDHILICKKNESGIIEWELDYKIQGYSGFVANDIYETSDGSIMVTGSITEINSENYIKDIYLVKISKKGEIVWEKIYNIDNVRGEANRVIETTDGGYAMVGTIHNSLETEWIVVKTDELGNINWSKRYESGYGIGLGIIQTAEGYIITGYTSSGYMNKIGKVIKIDEDGNEIKDLNLPNGYVGGDIIAANDGGYINLAVHLDTDTTQNGNTLSLIKLDESLGIEWQKDHEGDHGFLDGPNRSFLSFLEYSQKIRNLLNTGYFIVTIDYDYSNNLFYYYILKFNNSGDLIENEE